ncbi:MAG: hypothetical protein ACI8XO_003789, partial [Verrucomicrobiales bacterium]
KTNGDPLWLNAPMRIAAQPESTIQIRRGFGYGFVPANTSIIEAESANLVATKFISIEDSTTIYNPVAGAIDSDIDFGDNARLVITADVTIGAGATLTIGAGSIIRLAAGADIHVDGNFVVSATTANPAIFAPTSPGSAWGGFFLQETTSDVDITGAIIHGSGADQTWFDTNSGFASHRDEQATFLVGPAGAQLDLTDCYLIENTGQLLHNDEGGDITLTRCLLQGATTCGELTGGTLTVDRSALLLFPDENPNFADADNDAIYLTSGQHLFTNTVIGYTRDDGIDTGGSPAGYTANTTAQSCWFESILHEGMASSGEKHVAAIDSIFFNCGQALECGYDGPQSTMLRCLSVANMVGARFGDNYDWDYANSQLTVTDSLLLNNLSHDIWGYDWASWTYNDAKMEVSGTKISKAGDLAQHPQGNSAFDPIADAALIARYMPVPASAVGIAITKTPTQAAVADYPQQFTVQLSTFSSKVVTAEYTLTAMPTLDAQETTLHTGTLTFSPSETRKTLDLPLPAGDYALVRLALGAATNAANTGGEAWFLDSTAAPNPPLIARGSDWKYSADRAEPTAGWKGDPFDDDGWESGPTPIGYGDGDEETVLSAEERGPGDDRTTAVYFRKEFQVANADAISALTLNLQRDDGAVVYLNGNEVARSNMDPGTVEYSTRAGGSAGNFTEENTYYELELSTSALLTGTNVLSVEIHQSSLSSSDLSFDLDLIATSSTKFVNLLHLGSAAYIYWIDDGAVLHESDDLLEWSATDASSPFQILTDEARKFYRLHLQ